MKLSIIIPAHNEAERLPDVLRSYADLFSKSLGKDAEIIVVANNCTDDTAAVARSIASDYPQIRIIDEKGNIGKGGAVILGAKQAKGAWIGFVDADGATPAKEFARLYKVAQKSDGVIASRWMPSSNVTAHQKWLRLLSSRMFNIAIRTLLGLKYRDTQCGAKIFKAEAWKKILPHIGITRFAFDVDVLFQLKREKYQITEEATEWHDVAGSKVNVLGSSVEMFLAIIRMRLLHSPLKPLVRLYERTISKPVEFLLKDPLFRHTVLLSSAAMIIHVCNISFTMVVGRGLPEEEYTLLITLLASFAILTRPAGTLAAAINHYTSLLSQKQRHDLVGKFMRKWLVRTTIPSVLVAVACIIFADTIASYFHLNRIEPVIIAAIALPAFCVSPVLNGTISGMQHFGFAAVAKSLGAIMRVALTAFLILCVHPASGWALLGHTAGLYMTLAICLLFLIPVLRRYPKSSDPVPSIQNFMFFAFFTGIAGGILLTGDIIFVRRYLPEQTDFAYAATISRMAIFLSTSVVASMFPKVSSDHGFRQKDRQVYLRALSYTGVCMICALLVCVLIPELLLKLFFNLDQIDKSLITITRLMGGMMTVATILMINQQLLLAQRRFKALLISILCAFAYAVTLHYWHPSVYAVILVGSIANSIAAFSTTIFILRSPQSSEDT